MNTYDFKLNNPPLFEKYIINKSYGITRMREDGSEEEIDDPNEKNEILDTDFLAGSFAISRDTNHVGLLHKMFYVGQRIHSFFRGRNGDENLCHGMIYLNSNRPEENKENTHPFIMAHALPEGIHTSVDDYVCQEDVTEVVIYRPRSESLKNTIIKNTKQTAFVKNPEHRAENSPAAMSSFSYTGLASGAFFNGAHEVCGKKGSKPPHKIMESSAYLFADMILGRQIMDKEGELKSLFCIPYGLAILQASFLQDSLQKKFFEEELKAFTHPSDGQPLNRQELAEKILQSFQYDNKKSPIAHELWQIYWGNKFVRLNYENMFSSYIGKNLDKLSKKSEKIKTSHNVVNYVPPKESTWLQRSVRWYKQKICLPPLVKKIISYIAMGVILAVSFGLLLPFVLKVQAISYKIDLEIAAEKFKAEMENKLRENPSLRPTLGRIELKSKVSAFNHVTEFTINGEVIWHRRRDVADAEWQPMFFDGDLTGTKPVTLSADGANLVVIDDRGVVHYRKVLSEGLGYEDIYNNPNLKRHLEMHPEIQIHKKDVDSYFAVEKADRSYWQSGWYNFPVLKHIVNAITGPDLVSSGHISHLGRYAGGFTDAAGNYYRTNVGVTTLYEMIAGGTAIRKFDPWAPKWSHVLIAFPKTDKRSFIGKKYDASASTIMTLGYTIEKETKRAKLVVLTNLADIDTMGGNPCMDFAYQVEKNTDYRTRILPDVVDNEGWTEHTLPEDIHEVFGQISIFQTGVGNERREMRLAVKKSDGEKGYYRKANLKPNTPWEFIPYSEMDESEALPLRTEMSDEEMKTVPFAPILHAEYQSASLDLLEFDEEGYHSKLQVKLNDKTYTLYLHKRLGLGTFLGRRHEKFALVLPEDQEDDQILQFLGGQKKLDVNLKVHANGNSKSLTISCLAFSVKLE